MSNSSYMDWVMNDGYGAPIFRPRQRPAGSSGPPPGAPAMPTTHPLTLPPNDPMNNSTRAPRKQRQGEKMKISPRYIPCKFHTSPGGCKVGDKCHYYHADVGVKSGSKSRPLDPPKFGYNGPVRNPPKSYYEDSTAYASPYDEPGPYSPSSGYFPPNNPSMNMDPRALYYNNGYSHSHH